MSIKRIIGANPFKHGGIISNVNMLGSSQIVNAELTYDDVLVSGVIDSRMKLNRYYSGDEAGSTTVTYSITEGADDGYWRTSKSSAHDPGSDNFYGSPVTSNDENIIGFSRPW